MVDAPDCETREMLKIMEIVGIFSTEYGDAVTISAEYRDCRIREMLVAWEKENCLEMVQSSSAEREKYVAGLVARYSEDYADKGFATRC